MLQFVRASPAAAKSVHIDVDTTMAARLVEIACSRKPVDAAQFARSPLLKSQLAHHSRFGSQYSLDAYVAGVNAISGCTVPDPDPFRFAALVKQRAIMTTAIAFLVAHQEEMASKVAAMILPYVPDEMDFRGSVVLAPASFSCGGFAHGKDFFIDVPCIAENIAGEYDAVTRLVAHETYHSLQDRLAPKPAADFHKVATPDQAAELLFSQLAMEGSASLVGDMLQVTGDGQYARFSRAEAKRGFARLPSTFKLFDYALELLRYQQPKIIQRLDDLDRLTFGGALGQPAYYMGQQMSLQIATTFGTGAIPCVLALPPENFIFAYQRALDQPGKLKESEPLGTLTVEVAEGLAASRKKPVSLAQCLTSRPHS
ncbi:MAG: DUF5700 domain-containing putative Zn-dependent protease [Sphingomicrobium sp.]